jgi:hypothetical protein
MRVMVLVEASVRSLGGKVSSSARSLVCRAW